MEGVAYPQGVYMLENEQEYWAVGACAEGGGLAAALLCTHVLARRRAWVGCG